MSDDEPINVKGVLFEVTSDSVGRLHACMEGQRLPGHLKRLADGRFRVSFIEQVYPDIHSAVEHLAYWYTMNWHKMPLQFRPIPWPDGSITESVTASTDSPLQLTVWQVEIQLEEARAAISKLPTSEDACWGKDRVYKAEIGLKVHRTIELLLKVLLGFDGENDAWRLDSSNRTHNLTPLYDKLKQKNARAATQLDTLFGKTVLIHGNPRFGRFCNPFMLTPTDGRNDFQVTLMPSENNTVPGAQGLRDHLALIDTNSTYNQAYLGDAVTEVCEAYLKYLADSGPFLDFAEAALREVVMPFVNQLLCGLD